MKIGADRKVSAAALAFALGLLSSTGCSTDNGEDKPCPHPAAAFELTLETATQEPLPDDTALTVKFNGGEETYRLNDQSQNLEDVRCVPSGADSDGGDEGGVKVVDKLLCELWTAGAAKITIKASGYPDYVRDLKAEKDSSTNCLKTVPVPVVLGETDAGS